MNILGRLQKVDLREIWRTEDQHFTPWLAREENLSILAETLAMELELEAEENAKSTLGFAILVPIQVPFLTKKKD